MQIARHAGLLATGVAALFLSFHAAAEQRTATADFPAERWLASRAPFDIILSGEGAAALGVLFDKIDVSALFQRVGPLTLRYDGKGLPLPAGQHTITVFEIDGRGSWTPIGQFPIRILTPRGFVSTRVEPAADLTGKGQFSEAHSPDENAPDRAAFQDGTSQFAIRTELVRPAVTVRAEAQLAGVTNRTEALRFGTEGDSAPKLDLAGYRVDVQRGTTVLSLGHVGYGSMRHLINGFQSRGFAVTVGDGRPVSLQLAVMNGSSIVGWSNALGLASDSHRVMGATLGLEAFRSAPGKLRFEYGYFRGSVRPFTGFNQGGVVTAEKSRGSSLRVASSTLGGRVRLDSGYTISRFESAFDEQVESGLDVTPIEARTRSAWYADMTLELLRNRKVGRTTAGATMSLRLEDIEPLFRSLGSSVQPDLRSAAADLAFNLGSVTGTASHLRTRDNLAAITSILTTRTERSAVNLGIPVATLFGIRKGARWVPIVSIQADALHQFGDGIPIGGDFTIESIPDLESRNLLAGAEWQLTPAVRAGVKLGEGTQDNLQIGSENRDFITRTRALTFGWTPRGRVSVGGELGVDRNESVADERTDSTLRWAATLNWTIYKEIAFAGAITNIRAFDNLDARDSENIDSFLELSAGFRLSRADKRKGRIFVRWTDRQADVFDRAFELRDSRRSASFATGLTMSLF
jgi:hypothetical protein